VVVAIPLILVGAPYLYIHFADGTEAPPLTLPVGPGGTSGPVTGTWTVSKPSQVQYRIAEDLLGQHHIAVGSTTKVSGTVVIAGATITYAEIKVDMGDVTSDQTGRNVAFRDFILDTGSHPHGDFTLTKPIDLGTVPATGHTVTVQAVGTLTLRGVTRPVTFPLVAEREGDQIVINGSLQIQFSLWHIPNPSFAVAQVGKFGTIGVLLYLDLE
jgi:polyisoprenoid-binding protein YceI